MTIRKRGARYSVEIYDPAVPTTKRYVGTFGTQREARDAARLAEEDVRRRRGQAPTTETVASFAARWLDLFPRAKGSTNLAYAEQIKPFVSAHGDRRLREIDVQAAVEWVTAHQWTHGGVRAMFSDARRLGIVDANPFTGLRLRGSRGRRDLEVLTVPEVHRLAACASVWEDPEVEATIRTLILCAAFVGMRPAELYGLRWSDLDLRADEIRVVRQYSPRTREFTTPKNGRARTIVLTTPAREALADLPRPVDGDALIFRASRGGPITGRVQHYYWHPVRVAFGQPSLDFYALRHFCASWLFNDLGLPAQDVAHQLGHTDGGSLVQRLYGHPSEDLARERIKRAMGGNVRELRDASEANRRHTA